MPRWNFDGASTRRRAVSSPAPTPVAEAATEIGNLARRGGRARLKASDSKSDRGASPSGVQILSPPPNFSRAMNAGPEGWPSGRRCGTGNAVYGQLYRGFESHPLRQFSFVRFNEQVGWREGSSCEAAPEDRGRGVLS